MQQEEGLSRSSGRKKKSARDKKSDSREHVDQLEVSTMQDVHSYCVMTSVDFVDRVIIVRRFDLIKITGRLYLAISYRWYRNCSCNMYCNHRETLGMQAYKLVHNVCIHSSR